MAKNSSGLSLFELLIGLALFAVLSTIAVPSFEKIAANGRVRTETDALFRAVYLARKESILRRQVVSICPSVDGQRCSASTDWSAGWILFENADRDEPPQLDSGETMLRAHRTAGRIRITANRRGFTLRAIDKRATNGTLVICDQRNRVAPRALVVSYTGRPRVALEKRNGERYFCLD